MFSRSAGSASSRRRLPCRMNSGKASELSTEYRHAAGPLLFNRAIAAPQRSADRFIVDRAGNFAPVPFRSRQRRRGAMAFPMHHRRALRFLDEPARAFKLGNARVRHLALSARRIEPAAGTRSVRTQFFRAAKLVGPTRIPGVRRRDDRYQRKN